MASTVARIVGTEVTYLINPDALANSTTAGRQGPVIDLTVAQGGQTGAPDDIEFAFQFQTASGSLGTNPVVYVYAAPLATSTNYTDGCSGSDGAFTFPTSPASYLIATIPISAANTATYLGGVMLSGIGFGNLPTKVVLWVNNQTGLALAGSVGAHVSNIVSFRPVQYEAS
jgi:hypothetical protein